MESYIVVGGGLAGLTAANALADGGHRVTLWEQSERLGGRAMSEQDRGYLLNLGPHALYRGGPAFRTLREWGIPFQGKVPDVSRQAWLSSGGRMFPFFTSATGLLRSRLFGLREKVEAAKVFGLLLGGSAAAGESMAQWLDRHTRSPLVRAFAEALTRVSTYTADLAHLSAGAALAQIRLASRHGVLYLDGGWQTLVDGLAQRARSLGVSIRNGEPVENLASLDAAGIILAVPPAAVERIAGVALPRLRPVRFASLGIGLCALPSGAARFVLGMDRPLYFSRHSLEPAVVYVGKYLDGHAESSASELEEFADAAMPGWHRYADVVRFLPNMTVTHAIAAPEGRPDVDAAGLENVAIAGDWVGPEGMLADAAVASALRAAAVVQRRKVKAA
jgi:glycine/D-amino acid oxidase-like deaminating enzyme